MINEKEYAKVIAVNLRNIMYERHLTQADLARDLNINKATISSWMNATRTVEPALNDDVMPSNAKLCQVPCQKSG